LQKQKDANSTTTALEDLNYCLDTLGINMKNEDSDIRRKIKEVFNQNVTSGALHIYGKRILALKIIADSCALSNISHIFSQSELYDFLTLAREGILEQKRASINEKVFTIYRDIMENYQTLSDSLRLNYPKIIVDVIAILYAGEDTTGKRIGRTALDEYYKSRKLKASSELTLAATAVEINANVTRDDIYQDHFGGEQLIKEERLIETLVQITGRKNKDLVESLAKLQGSDVKKVKNLCTNYNKIEKYCELAKNLEEFGHELEKELGRNLTDNQIQSAATSIRKVRKYIENLLDGRFALHDSHGINHIKHNLEYGYRVMGVIERQTRRPGKIRNPIVYS
jgi:hypothetical protein